MHDHPIDRPAQMSLEIPFDAGSVEIVAGKGEVQQAAAGQIAQALRTRCGADVSVGDDAAYAGWEVRPQRHAILMGSLGDNRGIEYLYYRWLTFVDNSYPGAGGYVLTTLWDPWGAGRNALIVGAADTEGLKAAVERLKVMIAGGGSGIPGLHEVVYGASRTRERDEVERMAEEGPRREGWTYHFTGYGDIEPVPHATWAYVRSGDRRIAEGMRKMLLELAASPVLSVTPNRVHLHLWRLTMTWPLVETAPVFSEEDRLKLARFFHDALASTEGSRNGGLLHMADTELPRQNHQTLCALGVLFGALYFERHHRLPEAGEWRALVERFFRIGAYCSKQICDNNQHGWNQSIGDFATYALLTGDTAFFDHGMARLAAERAAANCTSNGFAATIGDGKVDAYPNWLLAQVSFYLRDPGLRFVMENMAPEIAPSGGLLPSRQPYDAGLPAEPPDRHVGTRVFRLDRLYYDIPKNAPGHVALKAPNVPFERTFDVLTMRSGWGQTDQYLILDGTGGGSHSYEDANAILTFTQDDRFLLLSADRLYFTAPKYHNMVTVTRNGLGDMLPSYCRLDGKCDLPTFGFTATTLLDYVGMDWTRTLLWKKGDFFLVADRLVAREQATYSGVCRWFSLGRPELEEGRCVFHQCEWKGSRTDFVIENLSGQACRIQEAFYGPPGSWRSGYDPETGVCMRTDRTLLAELDQTQGAALEAGETMRFVNLLYARSGERVSERMEAASGSGWVRVGTREGTFAVCLTEGREVRADGLRATCEALAVWQKGAFAAGCSALKVGGLSIQFSRPCGVEVDASGRVEVDAPEGATVLWRTEDGVSGEREVSERDVWEAGRVAIPNPDALFGSRGQQRATGVQSGRGGRAPAPAWTAEGRGRVNALHIASLEEGPRVLAACESGALVAFDLDGRQAWTREMGSPVNTVHSGVLKAKEPSRVVLGCEDEMVYAIDADGQEEVWRYHVEYGHQFWPWWSWYNASVFRVRVDDMDGDGSGEVLVTSGNIRLRLLDAAGRQRWEYRTDHGLFLTYETCDLDGDGAKEIVGGCDLLSSSSICRVIGVNGEQRHAFSNAGWTSQVKDVLIADLEGDGKLEVACAVNRQENLRVHSFAEKTRRWGHCLGEVPAGLALLDSPDGPVLFAATEGPTAVGFSPAGDLLWTADVGPGALRVLRTDGKAAVVCVDGSIRLVRGDGSVGTIGAMPEEVTAAACAEGRLFLGARTGKVAAFDVLM